jgi:hypothetical protein
MHLCPADAPHPRDVSDDAWALVAPYLRGGTLALRPYEGLVVELA